MRKADGIFFDLGGTLRLEIKDAAYQDAAKRELHALLHPDTDVETFYSQLTTRFSIYKSWAVNTRREVGDAVLWGLFLQPELDESFVKAHCHELSYLFRKTKGRRETVPHGAEVLWELKARGYRLGIISNLIGEDAEVKQWILGEHLEGIFETIVLSSVCGLRKPGDAIYRLACDDMGIEPARCASVGDNLENDIPGAWRAGIGLNILYHSPEQRHIVPITDANRPDFEIWDFRELLHIFEA
ncbi:MAG: HAD family hydrolase [Clostridia bacterium]|nr:HAD family hydrolase [Clostridia bacterium]